MLTNGDILRAQADAMGVPLGTLDQVKARLAAAKARAKGKNAGLDAALAGLMYRHGRMTDEARAWLAQEYPQEGQ